MGTRNLTIVAIDGEYKVAKYCQWDGYPEGQGIECLKFLRGMDKVKFADKVRSCTYITYREALIIRERYTVENDVITISEYERFSKDYPELSRNTGAEILNYIQHRGAGLKTIDDLHFAADSLFCEYAYVIDLDKNAFEAYTGFNMEELTEEDRFYFLEKSARQGYHPVKLVAKWSLDDLPEDKEFIEAFIGEDEEESDE